MAFTFFFRDEQILELAADKLVEFTTGRSNVRVLNAGCAMGHETYSFAIMLAERLGKFALRNTKILAVDIDNENVNFGKTLTDAVYHKDLLQRVPSEFMKKYFSPADTKDFFIVNQDLKSLVEYRQFDLLSLEILREDFSLVICKNVLLHFSYPQRVDVIRYFHKMLMPGGLLVMENTQPMPEELAHKFERVESYGRLYKKV
jgi:chemotaxis protein methyltransferase CheR